ncbi:hypothetical protein HMPREF9104_02056, partial [Lentilactobacillus kisonensis F0435]
RFLNAWFRTLTALLILFRTATSGRNRRVSTYPKNPRPGDFWDRRLTPRFLNA